MNRTTKKVLCFILSLILIFPSVALSYEGHWAQDSIDYLLEKEVITGDKNGVRPDDFIKRCEYAKIINKLFEFSATSETEFPDVSKNSWYYNDMQIAKAAGYFIGDANGNANPEGYLTRAEACVVYARLLKLDITSRSLEFDDAGQVPHWAKGSVCALSNSKIIIGYSDGEFKPQKTMTRAEVFAISLRVINHKKDNSALSLNTFPGTVKPSASSGGGGSGGGGVATPPVQTTSFIRVNTETLDISWNRISGASSFSVKIVRTTNGLNTGEEITLSDTSVNLKEKIDSITSADRNADEKIRIAVKSNLEATYASWYEFEYKYPSVNIPDDFRAVSETDDNGLEKVFVKWTADSNANRYELSVKFDENEGFIQIPCEISNGEGIAEIPTRYIDGIKEKHSVKFRGISGNSEVLDSKLLEKELDMPLFASGKGTVTSPYIIINYRHFRNIKHKASAGTEFTLAKNIILPPEYVPFEFAGNIKGDEEDVSLLRTITLDINTTGEYAGLFSKITSGSVSNIKIEGTVKGKSYVGAIAGESNATITNCINNANIVGTNDYIGGFAGTTSGGSIEKSINYGDISGSRYVGGIVGMQTSGTEKNCANAGNVTGTGNFVAGIAGYSYIGLENCFNTGNVKGASGVGGIMGYFTGRNTSIKNSYNTGVVEATATGTENIVGGIIGTINASAKDARNIEIINSYNTGVITAKDGSFNPIYPKYTPANPDIWIRAKNCYYLSENTQDDGMDNTTPLTSAQLENLVFSDEGVLSVNPDTLYPYPELPELPHVQKTVKLSTPSITSVEKTDTYVKVTVEGDINSSGYTISVYNDENLTDKIGEATTVDGGALQIVDITSLIAEYKYYYLTVVADSESIYHTDSDVFKYTYWHKAASLSNPVLASSVVWSYDNGTEKYTISWDEMTNALLTGFEVEISDGNSLLKTETLDKTATSYNVCESAEITFGGNLTVSIKALGSTSEQNSNPVSISFTTVYASGEGTDLSPYIVMNERHFNNIRNNAGSVYSIENDIDLTGLSTPYEPFAFTGKLIGSDEENLKTIHAEITGNTGLFTQLTGGVIKNLKLTGSVSGTTNVGGFVGTLGAAKIINCINAADIAGTGNNIGGIAGTSNSGSSLVEACVNEGIITGNAQIGGIVGYARGSINKCANYNDITGSSTNVGGIIGSSSTGVVINECYNTGDVLTRKNNTGVAGGIAGGRTSGTLTISNCYNSGNVKSTTNTGTAGIVSAGPATVNYSYNGKISRDIVNPVCSSIVTAVDCYYLSDSADDDTIDNTTPLTSAQMSDLTFFTGYSDTLWQINSSSGYLYPQLINNPHTPGI